MKSSDTRRRCSFCDTPGDEANRLNGTANVLICEDCLHAAALAQELVRLARMEPRSAPPPEPHWH